MLSAEMTLSALSTAAVTTKADRETPSLAAARSMAASCSASSLASMRSLFTVTAFPSPLPLLIHRTSVVQELPETRPFLIRLALTPKLERLALVARSSRLVLTWLFAC